MCSSDLTDAFTFSQGIAHECSQCDTAAGIIPEPFSPEGGGQSTTALQSIIGLHTPLCCALGLGEKTTIQKQQHALARAAAIREVPKPQRTTCELLDFDFGASFGQFLGDGIGIGL